MPYEQHDRHTATHIAASGNPGVLAACRALSAAIQRSARLPAQRVVMRSTGEARLLVVDDEETILELLSGSLRLAGFEVATAASGAEALRAGLALGGDDYVTKPFSLDEVLERIRAVVRRTGRAAPATRLRVAGLELDEDGHEVRRDGALIALTPTEFRLLRFLMLNAGRVLSKGQILDHVWGHNPAGEGNVVEPCVSYLRRKVDQGEPRLIHTIRGVGYVLRIPPT
jgi:two-component system, OmpR family, response regulator